MKSIQNKLMELQTTRELANDEIWKLTEKLQNLVETKYNNEIIIEQINVWPEDGIVFEGKYIYDCDTWREIISWKTALPFLEKEVSIENT